MNNEVNKSHLPVIDWDAVKDLYNSHLGSAEPPKVERQAGWVMLEDHFEQSPRLYKVSRKLATITGLILKKYYRQPRVRLDVSGNINSCHAFKAAVSLVQVQRSRAWLYQYLFICKQLVDCIDAVLRYTSPQYDILKSRVHTQQITFKAFNFMR